MKGVSVLLVVAFIEKSAQGFVVNAPKDVRRNVISRSTPEWDSIMPQADREAKRAKEVRDRIAQLREYKKQGRRYDGERIEEETKKKTLNEDAGFSQIMNEAESFFSNSQETSSVGGSWTPTKKEAELHKPKVATWGRFPRPKDISKAYGGGKRIGVGADIYVNETAEAEKQEATARALARFREKNGADRRLVEANAEQIQNAIDIAKKFVLRGNAIDAIKILKPVVDEFCSVKTSLGATAMLELALCYEAATDTENAKSIYAQLARSPISEIKRRALQLSFGFEAQEKLQVGSYADSQAAALARSVWQFDLNDLGASSPVYLSGSENSPTSVLSTAKRDNALETTLQGEDDAFDVLRRATIGGAAFATPDRVATALSLYDTEIPFEASAAISFCDEENDLDAVMSKQDDTALGASPSLGTKEEPGAITTNEDSTIEEGETLSGLDMLDGDWTVVMAVPRNNDASAAKYAPKGTTISFDPNARTISRRIPILGGNVFIDWLGRAETLKNQQQPNPSVSAICEEVQPGFFSAFADADWRAQILHLDDRILALRGTSGDRRQELLLCKRLPRRK